MPFTLLPLTASDIPACVSLYFRAFQNAHSLACWPRSHPAVRAWWEKMFRDELDEPGAFWLKAVASSVGSPSSEPGSGGAIAGYCKWVAPKPGTLPSVDLPGWPQGADARLCEETFGAWARERVGIMGVRGHWYLEMVATDPAFQGQGAGSLMLGWGTEKADQDGVEAYLEASPEGVRLYEKFGWREAGKLDTFIDNERVRETWYRNLFMVRPARAC